MQLDDARRVLRVLTAAFPTYPMADDTVELYLALMVEQMPDGTVAFAVAADWATSQMLFPKPVELVEEYANEVGRRQRRANAVSAAQGHYVAGQVACRTCNDTKMVATAGDADGHVFGHPCPDCDAERYEYWQGGHLSMDHDLFGCSHPVCERRAKARRGRR